MLECLKISCEGHLCIRFSNPPDIRFEVILKGSHFKEDLEMSLHPEKGASFAAKKSQDLEENAACDGTPIGFV